MRYFIITEIDRDDECIHKRYIRFPLPDVRDDGFYRATMSFNAFFSSLKKRNYNKNLLYHMIDETDLKYDKWKRANIKELGITNVESIWEFYKLINYDYKKKKYNAIYNKVCMSRIKSR